ncbi:MAG: hypothetical protein N3B13_09710, partial [Deltaproteobacteria bacterium]|nr:hypothetical protein [Deltaproteobacteria bacterium]
MITETKKFLLGLIILLSCSVWVISCGDDNGDSKKDVQVITDAATDTEIITDKGNTDTGLADTEMEDAEVKDTEPSDIMTDISDTDWNPTTEEYNEAIKSIEEEGLLNMMVNLSAAISESSAQFEEIESIS